MVNAGITLVVGANDQQIAHLKNCLPAWECVSVPVNNQRIAIECSTTARPEVVILYAQAEATSTLAICEQLRSDPNTAASAILLAISRYELSQRNAIEPLGNTGFIFKPFDQEELIVKIDQLLNV